MARDIAEGAALTAQHAYDPDRLGGEIEQFRQRPFRRHRHAFLDILVAAADHLKIDRQHQCAAFCGDGALNQRLDEAAILYHIELEPERLVDRGRDVLDRTDRHRALREGNARGLPVLHSQQSHRRQDQRQRCRLAKNGDREITTRDVDQHALAKLDLLKIVVVGAERILGIRTTKKRLRKVALVKLAQILDAGDVFHGNVEAFLYLRL